MDWVLDYINEEYFILRCNKKLWLCSLMFFSVISTGMFIAEMIGGMKFALKCSRKKIMGRSR